MGLYWVEKNRSFVKVAWFPRGAHRQLYQIQLAGLGQRKWTFKKIALGSMPIAPYDLS